MKKFILTLICTLFLFQNAENEERSDYRISYMEKEKIQIETIKGIKNQLDTIQYEDVIKNKAIQDSILSNSKFTIENLRIALRSLGIKHPDVVIKQAALETDWFKSRTFRKANNLFGMHRATRRPNTQSFYIYADPSPKTGKKRKVAGYDHWYDSVKDYKLYQKYMEEKRNLKITMNTDYYNWLRQVGYCETSSYTSVLRKMRV